MADNKALTVSQNAFYNTVGTIIYCLCQWIMSALLVVHLSPADISVKNTGMLQLAISVANIFYAVAIYNMRTYQVSDVNNNYSSGEYVASRIITCSIAFILCIAYSLLMNYSSKVIMCITVYMLFKIHEAFCDVLHGVDQKNLRMDYVGKSYIIRGIIMVVSFGVVLWSTKDILIAIAVMTVATSAFMLFYDIPRASGFEAIKPSFDKKAMISLLGNCLPAVISLAVFTSVANIPRQILEKSYGEESLGFYATIATPLLIVQVLATGIFNPILTELSVLYNNSNSKSFLKLILKCLAILTVISAAVYILIPLIGEFAVGIVFGKVFVPYTFLMYGIMGCTVMYTVCWLFTSVMIIMRKLKSSMIISFISFIVMLATATPFVKFFKEDGVSYSIIASYIVFSALSAFIILRELKKGRCFSSET